LTEYARVQNKTTE